MKELQAIVAFHERSLVEFSRQRSIVLCGEDYRVRTISAQEVQQYLYQTKIFLELTATVLNRKD